MVFISAVATWTSSSLVPGSILGRVRAVAGRHVVSYSINDEKFDVDSWGNVIFTGEALTSGLHEFVVTASTEFQNATTVQKVIVESDTAAVGGRSFRVKENSAPETITEIGEDQDILLVVPSTSAFKISDGKLVLSKPLDYENSSNYHVLDFTQLITKLKYNWASMHNDPGNATLLLSWSMRCPSQQTSVVRPRLSGDSQVKVSDDLHKDENFGRRTPVCVFYEWNDDFSCC
ncbi:hypothetical protein COOONC_10295 [Cooperia oncophora]